MNDNDKPNCDDSIKLIGTGYMYAYLNREGYTIYKVHKNPDHHFQILAEWDDVFIMLAVRTTYHPDVGTISEALENS